MPDFNTLQLQVDVVKAKIDALSALELNAEQILYISQSLATLANTLGVDDIVSATADAVLNVQAAGLATIEIVEGTANGAAVTELTLAYDGLQASYNNIEPRVTSLETTISGQESAILTATAFAASVQLNPWTLITASTLLAHKDRVFVSSVAGMVLTLPSSPDVGASIEIVDAAGTAGTLPFVIAAGAGELIQGINEALSFNVANQGIKLVYSGALYGWRII